MLVRGLVGNNAWAGAEGREGEKNKGWMWEANEDKEKSRMLTQFTES